jgi:N-acetylglucosamine malate deacetylase 1
MNILAVGAHPDDLEILCGGTLAKYALCGNKIYMASLTNGNMGHPKIKPDEMARIRKGELTKSASLIGAEVIWIDIDDEMSEVNLESRLRVVDAIRYARPGIIFTHGPADYHVDHRNTGQLVFEAAPLACIHNVARELPVLETEPLIYYMDNIGGIGFMPSEFVDICDTIEIKKKMFKCHESQIQWMLEHSGFDFTDVIETVAKFRGFHAGVKYAEGFKILDAWYRGTTKRVLP